MGGFFGGGGGASVDLASPSAIGSTTPNTGKFTTLEATTSLQVSTSGFVFGGTNLLEQRNSTSAQTFRIYNTFTDSSNYERGFMRWAGGIFQIGTEKLGTGSAKNLEFCTDNTARWSIETSGALSASSNASTLNVRSMAFQYYAIGNALISENCVFSGGWKYVAAGAAGMFYFYGTEGQFRFFASGSAGAALPGSGNNTQFKVNADGTVALGGNGSYVAGTYTDNTLVVSSTTVSLKNGANISFGTSQGTKIGTSTSQLIGFFNATPVDQPATVTDPTGGSTIDTEARTAINAIIDRLQELGLIA